MADLSELRLEQSYGLMVNYRYHPSEIEANHEAYARQKVITVSPQIGELLRGLDDESLRLVRTSRRGGGLGRMIGRT